MKNNKHSNIAINIKNISKTYIKNKKEIEVLRDISYKFEFKKFYCIFGRSGIGKSTLIKIMGTMIEPNKGSIEIDNRQINLMSEEEKSKIRNKKIGFVFQDYNLIDTLTAEENVLMPIYFNDVDNKKELVEKSLNYVNMLERKKHYPKELSGGECQRVAIARALINNPDIILADEPTGSLDKDSSIELLEIFRKLANEGKCIILVSHDNLVEKYADINLSLKLTSLEEGVHDD